jgi:hypothetical protein
MSHHLDSPAARADARLNISDLYVFRGETGTVLVMNTCSDAVGPDGPKGFHPEARYEFKIDGSGNAVEDLTFRATFGAQDTAGEQRVELRRFTGAETTDTGALGTRILSGSTGETLASDDGLRLWTGRASDPFWMHPELVKAVGQAFLHGTDVATPTQQPSPVKSLFAGMKLYSIVLEIPDAELLPVTHDGRINVWGVTALAADAGGWRRTNRCGLPMVSPIFAQFNDELGERLNRTPPAADAHAFTKEITDMVAAVVAARGTADDPHAYGQCVAERVLPVVLPYTIGTPAVFGFATFNGRSLTDNVGDVMFSLTTNSALSIGLTKEAVDVAPTDTFPYVPAAA